MGSQEGSRYRVLATNAGFRRLWLSQTASRLGDSIHYVALVILVFDLTNSGVSVSAAVIFEALPVVLLGTVAGAVVDRYRRRSVMIVADLTWAVLALMVATAGSVWQIYALAFGLSLAGLVHTPAAQALLPNLVEKEFLGRANAALWSGIQSTHVLGSILGGALVVGVGARSAFVVNAVTFVVSAVLVAGVVESDQADRVETTSTNFGEEIRLGLSYALADRFLRRLFIVQFLAVLSVGGTSALLVVFARERLGTDSTEFGGLVAVLGVGALVGPMLTGRYLDRHQTMAWLFVPYVVRGAIDAALAFVREFWTATAPPLVYAMNASTGSVAYNTILQRRVT